MDHMERGSLRMDELRCLVLDEADEMLRMGFIDDVRWVLERTPDACQLALFSATMPAAIKTIAKKHLKNPEWIRVEGSSSSTGANIRQRYWPVAGINKLDALCRILEAEEHDGVIVFTRTKHATLSLADQLQARGFRVEALNGDIPQAQRETTVARLRDKRIDLLVATDVVARGLDVPRITHVFNYDMPTDTEAYVHRIGRTGRAGRAGEAILFVARREQGMLRAIERATGQRLDAMSLPSVDDLNKQRLNSFRERLAKGLEHPEIDANRALVAELTADLSISEADLAAVLASLLFQKEPLFLKAAPEGKPFQDGGKAPRKADRNKGPKAARDTGPMKIYRVEVGETHGVRPGNLVGAIANEGGLSSAQIGAIRIHSDHSTVQLPEGLSTRQLHQLRTARVCQRALGLEAV